MLLFITHDLGVVSQIADRIAVMQDGRIVEQTAADDFFADPQHAYSRQLLAAIPSWENRDREVVEITATETPELKVENLKVYFPIRKGVLKRTVGYIKAVDDVSFSLYEFSPILGLRSCTKCAANYKLFFKTRTHR